MMDNLEKMLQEHTTRIMDEMADKLIRESATGTSGMKSKARWKDESGKARKSLRMYVRRDRRNIEVVWTLNVPYGREIEFANQGENAIIGPTFRKYRRQILKMLAKRGG